MCMYQLAVGLEFELNDHKPTKILHGDLVAIDTEHIYSDLIGSMVRKLTLQYSGLYMYI